MSQNNFTSLALEKLVQRVATAEKTNQREIRITLEEARDLMADLSLFTAKMGKSIDEIHKKLDNLTVQAAQVTVQMDGGGF
jgi:septation ring formation regulator EzrA